jgi:hypothetical protein
MNIRNHGIDTVKVSFAYGHADHLGRHAFTLQTLEHLNVRLNSLAASGKVKSISIPNTPTYIDTGFIDNINYYSSKYFTTIHLSLPRFYSEQNVDGLQLSMLGSAIDKLSDLLGIDAGRGNLKRIDYCYNFNATKTWDTIIKNIKCMNKKFDSLLYNESTLYLKNKSREILFYSQVDGRYDEKKYKKERNLLESYQQKFGTMNLFRVELRLFSDSIKSIQCENRSSKGLRLTDLLDVENQRLLFNKYKSLVKVPLYIDSLTTEEMSDQIQNLDYCSTFRDYYEHLLAHYIQKKGANAVLQEVQSMQFKQNNLKSRIQKTIKHALKNDSIFTPNTSENTSDIKKLIINEIENQYRSRSTALF